MQLLTAHRKLHQIIEKNSNTRRSMDGEGDSSDASEEDDDHPEFLGLHARKH